MFIDFETWHVDLLDLSKSHAQTVAMMDRSNLKLLSRKGYLFTVIAGGGSQPIKVIGVMGAVPKSEEMVEVFLIPSQEKDDHIVTFVRAAKRLLEEAVKRFQRVEALRPNTSESRKFLEWLGFEPVGRGRWRLS